MKIRRRRYASGTVAWQVDFGIVNNRRVQRAFETRAAAERALRQFEAGRDRHGEGVLAWTESEVAEVRLCRELLGGRSLLEAVRFFVAHSGPVGERVSVQDAMERFIDSREEAGGSARYLRQLRVSLGGLVRMLGGSTTVAEIDPRGLERWLDAGGWAPKTRNNYLGDARAWLAWCVRHGLASRNVAAGIEKRRAMGDSEIGTLDVEACEVLLKSALDQPAVMGALALGLFGGLRPAEIARLTWDAVRLDERVVIVEGSQSKTRRRRIVDLTENALAWIVAAKVERHGKICGRWHEERWRRFRQSCGWTVGGIDGPRGPWPHNALRHSYASYHYALHQNEARLQAQMGHESPAMLHRHYRALRTRSEAERFWALRPNGSIRRTG